MELVYDQKASNFCDEMDNNNIYNSEDMNLFSDIT